MGSAEMAEAGTVLAPYTPLTAGSYKGNSRKGNLPNPLVFTVLCVF